MNINRSKQWVNFAELRGKLPFGNVLEYYKVSLARKGDSDQYIGPCPLPSHGEPRGNTFSANYEKGIWQCFGCKQSGNVLDFAVLMAGLDKGNGKDVRKVALELQAKILGVTPADTPAGRSERRNRSVSLNRPEPPKEKTPVVVNRPLDFALKTLEADHLYFSEHKLRPDTVERFGLGFCKRGTLAGRIAIPLHNDVEELVGYAGLIVDEYLVSDENPRYLFPENREHEGVSLVFDRYEFLYNGCRMKSAKDIIVVQEPETVWRLWQGGFANVVALMGDECSDEQTELLSLLSPPQGRVWLLTDKTDGSVRCATSALLRVASSRMCRWVRFEKQSDIAPEHPLLELLPKR